MKRMRLFAALLAFAVIMTTVPVNAKEETKSPEILGEEEQSQVLQENDLANVPDSPELSKTQPDTSAQENETAWKFEKITTVQKSPQALNTDGITIRPEISGTTKDLEYKFVWMKNGWEKWGTIQKFSKKTEAIWKPSETGKYTLYVDVRDANGKVQTKSVDYTITDVKWAYEGTEISPGTAQNPDAEINVKVKVSGNTKGMQYKFVWERDGWKEWGIIQNFSDSPAAKFTLQKPGDYKIYVDIKDWKGNVTTQITDYKIMTHIWEFEGISTDLKSPQEKYSGPIQVSAETSGDTEGLEYKFVWEKDGWKEWGIIQKFAAKDTITWSPKEVGKYNLYVDIKDIDGNVVTKSIPYEIVKVKWTFSDITTTPAAVQKKGKNLEIEAITSGNVEGLQYKFVWMRDDWKEWGIIRKMSDEPGCTWKLPAKAGNYTIYVDVKDRDGEVRSLSTEVFAATQLWKHEGVLINGGVSEQVYTKLKVQANTSGETENLKYKFVWMRDDWKEWGIIQNFGTESSAVWYPKEAGEYEIYSDIKDVDGRVQTVVQNYTVKAAPWAMKQLKAEGTGSYFVGDTATVTAMTTGQTQGLQYKFVQKNGEDWNDWKILRNFNSENGIEVNLNKSGNVYIYVDVKDQRGVVFDPFIIKLTAHQYSSAGVSSNKISLGKSIQIYPNISGGQSAGIQCKYVWMKDGWNKWGVIKGFSEDTSVTWTPAEAGIYDIYIDVMINGIVKTQGVTITVEKLKNGWYYENGYKFYYIDGVKQLDLDGILPKQSSYYIKVNRTTCTVTVFAQDGNNGYIIPVKRFACSVGLPSTPTPTGTYYTSNKYRWHTLIGPSYGQYCTRIVGGILFHSVAGYNMTSYNLNPRDYNKLGSPASHGCVRLCVRDAKWIYDNCSLQTKVTIYDSSDPGPLGKPDTIKIPSWQNWDPTDPNI